MSEILPNQSNFNEISKPFKIISDFNPSGDQPKACLLYTSPSPRDRTRSRMPSSA